jgi:hypothetical protein
VEFTRVFNAGTADQEELLTVLELLLNEQPPELLAGPSSRPDVPDLMRSE